MPKAPGTTKRLGKAFQTALARPVLNRLATIPVFQQGQELLLHHHLTGLELDSDEAAANVQDGKAHLTRLWMEDGFLQYECACERGAQGLLCAHAVAVALAALEGKPAAGKAKAKPKTVDLAQTEKILREQSSDTLAGLLLSWAQQDERLLHQLMSFAAREGGLAIDLKGYRSSMKKRLKRPTAHSNAAEYKRFRKAVELEMGSIQTLTEQGQAYAALELSADVLMILLTLTDYGNSGEYLPLQLIPAAVELFHGAARKARADGKVLIPHLLHFYESDPHEEVGSLFNLAEMLTEPERLEMAKAAELRVKPRSAKWEERAGSVRMLNLANDLYLKRKDYDAMDRVVLQYAEDDVYTLQVHARLLMKAGEPARALAFFERSRRDDHRHATRDWYWLRAEAHVNMGDPLKALGALAPLFDKPHSTTVEMAHSFAKQHGCWPVWRAELFKDESVRFLIHMQEEDFPAAWEIVKSKGLRGHEPSDCALRMREVDPEHAARVLAEWAAKLVVDSTYAPQGVGHLDVVAECVIARGVRGAGLAEVFRNAYRLLGAYGSIHLVRTREPLWSKAIGLLEGVPAPELTIVRRR